MVIIRGGGVGGGVRGTVIYCEASPAIMDLS